jgi:nicotinamide mononucleotide transporter
VCAGGEGGQRRAAGIPVRVVRAPPRLSALELTLLSIVSATVVGLSWARAWPIGVTEAWGFATGGVCVWLVVREHVANWPVGLANNVVFFGLFWQARLFADMALQVVYLALGVYGWHQWLRGDHGAPIRVGWATRRERVAVALALPSATLALYAVLTWIHGAAPFWDALTTVLSLSAQFLLTRKRFENWFLWIAADLVYVPLYLSRALPLTALLYAVFLGLCVVGLRAWSRSLRALPA